MTITELIAALEAVKAEHGDLSVIAWNMAQQPKPPKLDVQPAGNILEHYCLGEGPLVLQLN